MGTVRLSKSRILSGLQCPRRLWLELHHPGLAVFDEATQRAFAAGHRVGFVARGLYPGGVLVGSSENLSEAVRHTQRLLAGSADVVLYEPAFSFRDVLVRLDVLVRSGGRGHLIEVKSATAVRPHHVTDAAIQAWVVNGSGVAVDVVSVAHIDTTFVYAGDGRYEGLLHEVDVTSEALAEARHLPAVVRGLQRMAGGPAPLVAPGAQCSSPFLCPFAGACQNAGDRVARGRRAAGRPAPRERSGAADAARTSPTTAVATTVAAAAAAAAAATPAAAARGGRDDAAAGRRLAALPFPWAGLAVVSANPAVPVWSGTRPYERVPLAWSCHLQRRPGDRVEQAGYLADPADPSAQAFASSLLAAIGGQQGSVFVRGQAVGEQLRSLAARLPRLARGLRTVTERLVDVDQVACRGQAAGPPGARAVGATSGSADRASLRWPSQLDDVDGLTAAEAFVELASARVGGDLNEMSAHAAGPGLGQASFADLPEARATRHASVRSALAGAVARESQGLLEFASERAGERG